MSLAYSEVGLPVEYIRRDQIIKAAIVTIAELGYMNTTLIQIAKRGDVSAALISHYFHDKNGLMREVFRSLVWRVRYSTLLRLAHAKTPHERVDAVIDANLTPEEFDHNSSLVWLAFWGQVIYVPEFHRIQAIYQARMLSTLSHALRDLIPASEVRETAIAIAALIDGVWLRSTLSAGSEKDGSSARFTVKRLAAIILAAKAQLGHAATYLSAPAILPAVPEQAGSREVEQAVLAARTGQKQWLRMGGLDRRGVFARAAALVREQSGALARLEARETGRAMQIIERMDILAGAEWLDYLSGVAVLTAPARESDLRAQGRREPLGIVAENGGGGYPFHTACQRAASALACGNASIFNSFMQAPSTVMALTEIFKNAGLPEGVLTVLHGGDALARALRQHHALRPASGADDICDNQNKKTVFLILEDADLEAAVSEVLGAVARPEGQAGILIMADNKLKDELLLKLEQRLGRLVIGDPLEPQTELGRLASKRQFLEFRAGLKEMAAAGARLVVGGQRITGIVPKSGYFVAPALITARLARFHALHPLCRGTVVCLFDFKDEEDALAALQSTVADGFVSVFTRTISQAQKIAGYLQARACLINRSYPAIVTAREALDSAFGFEAVLARYTRVKAIYLPI